MTYHSRPKGYSLRTCSNRIGDILYVGTGDKLSGRGEDACTDAEFGVGTWGRESQHSLRPRSIVARTVGGGLGRNGLSGEDLQLLGRQRGSARRHGGRR